MLWTHTHTTVTVGAHAHYRMTENTPAAATMTALETTTDYAMACQF